MTSCQACLVRIDKGRQIMKFGGNIVRVDSILSCNPVTKHLMSLVYSQL